MIAPDPITIAGHTFEYTSVQNTVQEIPGAVVTAQLGSTPLAMTTSDAQGGYQLAVPTGGHALALSVRYAPPGYLASTVWLDAPLDRDLLGAPSPYIWPGDAPVWSDGAMNSVYSYPGLTRSPSAGTLQVEVRDCGGTPVPGVTVASSRGGTMTYIDSDGIAKTSLTATQGVYDDALIFNAEPGSTTLTLTGGGLVWTPVTIDVLGGEETTLVLIRGEP